MIAALVYKGKLDIVGRGIERVLRLRTALRRRLLGGNRRSHLLTSLIQLFALHAARPWQEPGDFQKPRNFNELVISMARVDAGGQRCGGRQDFLTLTSG